jgi:asparagine synthase (glutamine-hydrolysing)
MCGIFIYLKKQNYASTVSKGQLYDAFMNIKARGPDRSSFIELSNYGVYLGFHRLAIMDTSLRGDQPFTFENEQKQIYVLCNGEIYNFQELCQKYSIKLSSESDCEIILHLYNLLGLDAMIRELEGEFSFCVCEINKMSKEVKLFVGRDQAGTRMLYITGSDNEVVITSELKGSPFLNKGYEVAQFRPRHYLEISSEDNKVFDLNSPKFTKWLDFKELTTTIWDFDEAKRLMRETLIKSVRSMTIGHRGFCCLLSGGLDSSLVAAILAEYCRENNIVLQTFSIGTETSTDRPFAEMVAKHIGSIHHHVYITDEESLATLDKIPRIIESIDITTNRATCLQYMIVDWISRNTEFKVVFCGDGSDEQNGSYKYFHNAPNPSAFHDECVRLVEDIHYFDGCRAGMAATSCGLEIRFPFLNKELLNLVFSIDPLIRMPKNRIEKFLLRDAFSETNYLPDEVLWRSKEAFSDSYSSSAKSWFEIIRDHVDTLYADKGTAVSKEALHYKLLFEKSFGPKVNVTPYYWLPKWTTSNIIEPSARVLDCYSTN